VPGKNIIVITAIVFIDELSLSVALAMSFMVSLSLFAASAILLEFFVICKV
jgi:hypothetical protein